MTRRCPDKRCNAPEVSCRLGERTPAECDVWRSGPKSDAGDDGPERDPGLTRLPWSGAALGTTDLAFVTGRSEPKLVAVVGPHNAGKTTLLGMFYQQVGRSGRVGDGRFAGSYSLEGWEAIAHAMRWDDGAPRFPPHTSSGAGRAPGMLHLAHRPQTGRLADLLFADSPGEWFQRWSVDPAANDAEGARWVVERASALLVVADCEALSGAERGTARGDLLSLIRRVAATRRDRPVALVWAKADLTVPAGIRDAIREAATRALPDVVEFETSVVAFERDGATVAAADAVAALLDWCTLACPRGFDIPRPEPGTDPFFAMGFAA